MPEKVTQTAEAVGSGCDGLLQRSKCPVEVIERQKREERREKRQEIIRKTGRTLGCQLTRRGVARKRGESRKKLK